MTDRLAYLIGIAMLALTLAAITGALIVSAADGYTPVMGQ